MHRSIAVIDDDPGVRRSVARLLRTAGFGVATFESAEAFLSGDGTFQCLVVDIQLTGQGGLELDRQLAQSDRSAPIVFITSHEDYVANMASDETHIWLRKPFEASDLMNAIGRLTAPAPAHAGHGPRRDH